MAKKGKAKFTQSINNFCSEPSKTLKSITSEKPYVIRTQGKIFKIVPATLLPENITWDTNQFNAEDLGGGRTSLGLAKRKTSFNPGQINKRITALPQDKAIIVTNGDDGAFAIVHNSVELIDPHAKKTDDFSDVIATPVEPLVPSKPETNVTAPEENIEPTPEQETTNEITTASEEEISTPEQEDEAASTPDDHTHDEEADLTAVRQTNVTPSSFDKIKWSRFLHQNDPENKPVSAYDFVTSHHGVAVIEYAGRNDAIGFIFPYDTLDIEEVRSNGRWDISKFAKTLKGKWAKEPLQSDIVSIQNRRRSPMIFMTMGAALELRGLGLFKDAPDWVKDELKRAEAIKAGQKPPAPKSSLPTEQQPKDTDASKPAPDPSEPTTPTSAVTTTKPETTSIIGEIDNNMAILRQAFVVAKETRELVELDNGIAIGANERSIQAMLETISMASDMGIPTPDIERVEFAPSSMVQMMTALRAAWTMASDSESLIMLEPADGKRIAMTRNADLIAASKLAL